ncbi:MAG TPA: hypothetical protein VFZ83_11895 [Acidimicrobiia bacterium]|nr:hypothetical protein [Acidimicrobiia bacterium]
MLSSMDDYPLHQVAEPIRHVGSSDRNFYDRYYFNLHGSTDELFMVLGMGQYPNLATQDAFAVVCRDGMHRVVRASRELGDRADTTVGPFRVEVLEPLQRLRFVLEPTEHPMAFDLTWDGAIPAFEEPRHFVRRHGRVLFDTMRFAQTGCWTGTLEVGGETITITPDRWKGTRDRSWGVRPVGEAEPPGIRQGSGQMIGMWNYAPMQFDDCSILYILQEEPDGTRMIEEAVRIWADPERGHEWLGRPEYEHALEPGTRMVRRPSTLRFPEAPGGGFDVHVEPLRHAYIAIGTGYGMEDDWRHGMYQGPLEVQYREWPEADLEGWGWYGVVDHVARFTTTTGDVGYGLHEHGFFGPFPKYGLERWDDGAP